MNCITHTTKAPEKGMRLRKSFMKNSDSILAKKYKTNNG